MWNVAKCLGARNGPTPPTHTCHPLSIYPSASSSYMTNFFFCPSLLFVIGSFVSQTFLMPGLYIRSVFLWLHASEWKWIIYEPSEHASISPSFSFFLSLSLSPVLFLFLGMILLCVRAKRMTFNQAGNGFVLFVSQSLACVCVCASVRIEIDIHPQVIRERNRDGTWLQGSIGQTVTL